MNSLFVQTRSETLDHSYCLPTAGDKKYSYGRQERDWETTYIDIQQLVSNKTKLIEWMQVVGWIKSALSCPVCNSDMKLCVSRSSHSSSDGVVWKCRKVVGGKRHQTERSLRNGSWFSFSNLTLEELVQLSYMWSRNYSQLTVSNSGFTPATFFQVVPPFCAALIFCGAFCNLWGFQNW